MRPPSPWLGSAVQQHGSQAAEKDRRRTSRQGPARGFPPLLPPSLHPSQREMSKQRRREGLRGLMFAVKGRDGERETERESFDLRTCCEPPQVTGQQSSVLESLKDLSTVAVRSLITPLFLTLFLPTTCPGEEERSALSARVCSSSLSDSPGVELRRSLGRSDSEVTVVGS